MQHFPSAKQDNTPVALVDMGSNSVRLVIYDSLSRAPLPIHNEKVQCGLGRSLNSTGRLEDEAIQRALAALTRFVRIARSAGAERMEVLATAAAREAENGPDFIRRAEAACGSAIQVLTGEEEARLATLGVSSCVDGAEGFVGDLGGGSLELARFADGEVRSGLTLPAGVLRLVADFQKDRRALTRKIDGWLDGVDWLSAMRGRDFYVVGGAWRNLAKLHMYEEDYPLHVIHHYALPGPAALKFVEKVCDMPADRIAQAPDISTARQEVLPCAALLLSRLLRHARPERLIFSSAGVREGRLYDQLAPDMQTQDALLSLCARLPWVQGWSGLDGWRLHDWIAPAFTDAASAPLSRLRQAACLLSEAGRLEHPDYRADHVLTRIMRLPAMGLTHWERAFLGLAVASRYGKIIGTTRSRDSFKRLLSAEERAQARAIGRAMRLAYVLSGGAPDLLRLFRLHRKGTQLCLYAPSEQPFMPGDGAAKRLADLAQVLDCDSRIEVNP